MSSKHTAATTRRRIGRCLALGAALAALSTCALAGTASAQVNTAGPHSTFAWGDCSVTLGNVKTWNGAAVGGSDIACGHYRGFISARVDLWRWDGATWRDVGTSGWVSTQNAYRLSVQTSPPYCGGGTAYWDDIVQVNVDGYKQTFDLGKALGYYPQYAPPC
jgi:hypothetical protein